MCGPRNWERVLQVLKPEDICGINEHLLLEEEKDKYCKVLKLASVTQQDIDTLLSGVENIPTVSINPVLSRGSSKQSLLWIWYTKAAAESGTNGMEESTEAASAKEIENSKLITLVVLKKVLIVTLTGLCVEWCKAQARAQCSCKEL